MLEGVLTAGDLVAFLLYAVTIAGAVMSLAGFWGNLQEAAGAAERIFDLISHPLELQSPESPAVLSRPCSGGSRPTGVSPSVMGPNIPLVLDGIDVEIGEGERVALVGSSGAGKSTLAALIPRFYDVEAGESVWMGLMSEPWACRSFGVISGSCPRSPCSLPGPFGRTWPTAGREPPIRISGRQPAWPTPMSSSPASPTDTIRS